MPKTADLLLKEINAVFPDAKMPESAALTYHQNDCYSCAEVRRYLDASRCMEVDATLIKFLHQELYHLSPMTFRWLVPHYLRFCLFRGGEYSQDETYFLVYNLSPDAEFQNDTYQRLSALNSLQIDCLIHFLEWCASNENWVEIAEDVGKAINFLQTIK